MKSLTVRVKNVEKLYNKKSNWKFVYIHHANQKTIDEMYNNYSPVFILTTGRSGSKFIASLLNYSPNIIAYHEPQPALQYFPHFGYHHQHKRDILTKMIDAARMELILDVYIKKKIFVESNQCLTFFAPAIKDLFKRSKFVHIVRHPGDFVRSAVRKGWYKKDSLWESGRVRMRDQQSWDELDQIEKLCWAWNTINQFIEEFKTQIESDRIKTFRIEDLCKDIEQVQSLLQFVGVQAIPVSEIKTIQRTRINTLFIDPNEPPNIQRVVHFPKYQIWDEPLKKTLRTYCARLSEVYGYKLPENEADMSYKPLLSVIIPNYNNAKYLGECLDSVLNQTYENLDIIVSDDCSNDHSQAIIQAYEKQYPGKVRGLYLNKNHGVSFNRNYAIQHAKGEYITTLDSDDYYANPQKLEKEMGLIAYYKQEKQKDIIAFSDIMLVTDDNQFIRNQSVHEDVAEGMIFDDIFTRSCMIPRDFVARRTAYLDVGGYDTRWKIFQTWDLKLKLAKNYAFYYTGINGTAYRQHDAGLSSNPFRKQRQYLRQIFNNHIDFVGKNEQKQELVKKFSMFMEKLQQEYMEYFKYRFHKKLREENRLQAMIFGSKTLLYDFGIYGFVIILSLLLKKCLGHIHHSIR